MPESDVPQEFWDAVNKFIDLANAMSRKCPTSRISSVIMYAAARYNAFNFYALEANPNQTAEQATDFYCEQYRAMLLESMEALRPR